MRIEDAFFRDILENPQDDGPRLIFADWLEDHGEADRAAFIRAQCRLAKLDEDDPARPALEDEADDLLAAHEKEWAVPLRGVGQEWRRGFVEKVTLPARLFVRDGERLLAAMPVREALFLAEGRDLPGLAACPHLAWLERVAFLPPVGRGDGPQGSSLRDGPVQAFLESPYLGRLRALTLVGHGIEGPAIETLVGSGLLARLTALDLAAYSFGDRALRALLAGTAERLEELSLRYTNLTAQGALGLLRASGLPRLRTLRFNAGMFLRPPRRGAGLRELLAAPLLPRLTDLRLILPDPLRPADLADLASSPSLVGLTELHLQAGEVGEEGVRALANAAAFGRLRHLYFSRQAGVTPGGARALAESPHLAGLRTLSLCGNPLRDEGARALASGPGLHRVGALLLPRCGIGGPGVRALADAPGLAALRRLDLSWNFVGLPGAQALADSPHLLGLTELYLADTGLGPDAARALAGWPGARRLRVLELSDNPLGDAGVKALAESPRLARLRTLRLRSSGVALEGAAALLRSPHLNRLVNLDLHDALVTHTERERLRQRFGDGVTF